MDTQTATSRNIIDRRKFATHGFSGVLGIIVGLLFGTLTGTARDPDRDLVQVVSTALDRGQVYFAGESGDAWRDARVVLVETSYRTPCGVASRESGPFYCGRDERIYLELSFLRAIDGELARAYVVAHELGHHVQKLRHELAERSSVAIELQADCYAGRWMRTEQVAKHLAPGDIDAALVEAQSVGDDRLCPSCTQEQWTHGSGAARAQSVTDGLGGKPCR